MTSTFSGLGTSHAPTFDGLGEEDEDDEDDEQPRRVKKDGMGSTGSLHQSSSSPFEEQVR